MYEKKLIYAVEDDESIIELYQYALNNNDFKCLTFEKSEDLFQEINIQKPDIIILDIMLPTIDGFKTLKILKEGDNKNIPVIIVSAKDNELSKVKGLDMGANDYIAKPFGILELIARIKANVKKTIKCEENKISYKEIELDFDKYLVNINNKSVKLTQKEFLLLAILMKNYGIALSREKLLNEVWGFDYFGESRTIDMHIKELRQKISLYTSKKYIHTIRSVGYIFELRE